MLGAYTEGLEKFVCGNGVFIKGWAFFRVWVVFIWRFFWRRRLLSWVVRFFYSGIYVFVRVSSRVVVAI